MVKVVCETCGVSFNKPSSKTGNHTYCGKECYEKSRQRVEWTHPNCECSQYIDGDGRMRVWVPNHPRSYSDGYLLRNIVHWEYYNGQRVPEGYDIHHKDHNRLNDSKENLELIEHRKHAHLHNPKDRPIFTCPVCGCKFERLRHRIRYENLFCSQECYNEYRRK